MITMDTLEAQLKNVNFNINGWGRSEAKELTNILHDGETILDLVNGFYDGGFAMLVATNLRLILIDKKPLNYLTVEDVRYDMINEIGYSHRLIGAHARVATGNNKIMAFTSLNQQRLRKTIGHVQHAMAAAKKDQSDHASSQKEHLAQINQQLQAYLLAQHQQQQALKDQLAAVKEGEKAPEEVQIEPVKPSHELSDYLFAQSLLAQAKTKNPELDVPQPNELAAQLIDTAAAAVEEPPFSKETSNQLDDLYREGMQEIFGVKPGQEEAVQSIAKNFRMLTEKEQNKRAKKYGRMTFFPLGGMEIHPFRITYKTTAKAMKKRKKEASQKPEEPSEPAPINHRIFHLPV